MKKQILETIVEPSDILGAELDRIRGGKKLSEVYAADKCKDGCSDGCKDDGEKEKELSAF